LQPEECVLGANAIGNHELIARHKSLVGEVVPVSGREVMRALEEIIGR
jgi:hypothetical protein